MSNDTKKTSYNPPALEFKSSTFSVPVLVLSSDDLILIEQQLQGKIRLAPEFFKNSPLVLDVQEINKHNIEIDIVAVIELIRKLGLLPIGIRGGNAQQNENMIGLGIPIHSIHTSSTTVETKKPPKAQIPEPETKDLLQTGTTLITHPIRSGQRVYAAGDLVIVAPVSPGTEILAEGNIHVYGALRGRALAGVQGNTEARIFCHDLQAELISIAGNYKISEDLNPNVRNKPVQIYLDKHTLVIKEI
ncbi:MAG: septum site-determining protein MinC [Methylococcaceae bacterium]|nr:septum site-determining protein MinC [Methylococcaceae bacterium]